MGKTTEKELEGKLFIFWLLPNKLIILMENNEKNN